MIDHAKIKARREKLKLTQEAAAERAGFTTPAGAPHRQRWYDIESGKRGEITADTLQAIAKALRCRMDELMVDEDRPKHKR